MIYAQVNLIFFYFPVRYEEHARNDNVYNEFVKNLPGLPLSQINGVRC